MFCLMAAPATKIFNSFSSLAVEIATWYCSWAKSVFGIKRPALLNICSWHMLTVMINSILLSLLKNRNFIYNATRQSQLHQPHRLQKEHMSVDARRRPRPSFKLNSLALMHAGIFVWKFGGRMWGVKRPSKPEVHSDSKTWLYISTTRQKSSSFIDNS